MLPGRDRIAEGRQAGRRGAAAAAEVRTEAGEAGRLRERIPDPHSSGKSPTLTEERKKAKKYYELPKKPEGT